jgi:HSP20 family protein
MFERTFALPNTVDPEKIEARYENGVLFVTIPKAERAKPREIRVNTQAGGSAQVKTTSQNQQRVTGSSSSRGGDGNSQRDPEEEGSAGRATR